MANRRADVWVISRQLAITFLTLLAASGIGAEPRDTLTLTVDVGGAIPTRGQAILSLFASPQDYLQKPTFTQTLAIGDDGTVQFVIEQLLAGDYAVSVIYDEDNSGELNTGFLGIPTELVGFSNNAKGRFGPPGFDKASFELVDSTTIRIAFAKAKR